MSELINAIYNSDSEKAVNLINNGTDINAIESGNRREFRSALHAAVHKKMMPILQTLLDCRCNVDTCSADLQTPLHLAVDENFLPAITILLGNKANVNAIADDGSSPLYNLAFNNCKKGDYNPETLLMLLKYGADFYQKPKGSSYKSIIHYLFSGHLSQYDTRDKQKMRLRNILYYEAIVRNDINALNEITHYSFSPTPENMDFYVNNRNLNENAINVVLARIDSLMQANAINHNIGNALKVALNKYLEAQIIFVPSKKIDSDRSLSGSTQRFFTTRVIENTSNYHVYSSHKQT